MCANEAIIFNIECLPLEPVHRVSDTHNEACVWVVFRKSIEDSLVPRRGTLEAANRVPSSAGQLVQALHQDSCIVPLIGTSFMRKHGSLVM